MSELTQAGKWEANQIKAGFSNGVSKLNLILLWLFILLFIGIFVDSMEYLPASPATQERTSPIVQGESG